MFSKRMKNGQIGLTCAAEECVGKSGNSNPKDESGFIIKNEQKLEKPVYIRESDK